LKGRKERVMVKQTTREAATQTTIALLQQDGRTADGLAMVLVLLVKLCDALGVDVDDSGEEAREEMETPTVAGRPATRRVEQCGK